MLACRRQFEPAVRWAAPWLALALLAWLPAAARGDNDDRPEANLAAAALQVGDDDDWRIPEFDELPANGRADRPQDDSDDDDDDTDEWPNIREPGPDLGDFPNSAYTLPRGRAYIEQCPLTLAAADRFTPSAYAWPFLLRVGLTDDVEFRLMSAGLTSVGGPQPTTGFSPLIFDLKVHLWDEQMDWLLPAVALEVYIQSEWGSQAFNGGTQPSLNLNMDLPITVRTNLECTVGYSGVQDALEVKTGERFIPRHNFKVPVLHLANLTVNQFSVQWAVEQELTDRLEVFVTGYYSGGVFLKHGAGTAVGGGLFWTINRRLICYTGCFAGIDDATPPVSGLVGFTYAP
jgi:hypothetical protein